MAAEKDRAIENQEIADTLDVEPSTVGRWFDGASMPREDALVQLAEYFGVTPSWLRYGQEPRLAGDPVQVQLPDPTKDRKLTRQEIARAVRQADAEDRESAKRVVAKKARGGRRKA